MKTRNSVESGEMLLEVATMRGWMGGYARLIGAFRGCGAIHLY